MNAQVNGMDINYSRCPNEAMIGGLQRYFDHGIEPGHFLTALLSNDLRGCVERADDTNILMLADWVRWLYNYAPNGSWGSPENVQRYSDSRLPVELQP